MELPDGDHRPLSNLTRRETKILINKLVSRNANSEYLHSYFYYKTKYKTIVINATKAASDATRATISSLSPFVLTPLS